MNKISIEHIAKEAIKLNPQDQLKLLEKLVHNLKNINIPKKKYISWNKVYGAGKGLWKEDAQEYINKLREERI